MKMDQRKLSSSEREKICDICTAKCEHYLSSAYSQRKGTKINDNNAGDLGTLYSSCKFFDIEKISLSKRGSYSP